jgi:hypothetical protein
VGSFVWRRGPSSQASNLLNKSYPFFCSLKSGGVFTSAACDRPRLETQEVVQLQMGPRPPVFFLPKDGAGLELVSSWYGARKAPGGGQVAAE